MQFDEVLRVFGDFFLKQSIRYALAGGNALRAWGNSRATYDLDFVIEGARRRDAISFAESVGYETTHESEGYSNHHHPNESFGHVDFMYVYGATAEQSSTAP